MKSDLSTVNIASHLPAMARRQPHTLAVVFPETRDRRGRVSYTHLTYRQLDLESDILARGLAQIGIGPGTRAALLVEPSLDFFALVFALFKVGAVMVCIDPGIGVKNMGRCLAESEPTAFIGVPKAHLARLLLGWSRKTNRTNVLVGAKRWPIGQMKSLDDLRELGADANDSANSYLAATKPDDVAAILFTSGSTGAPKGAVYTHANFDAQVKALRQAYDITPGEVDLATFPLFALFAPALGMTAIIPDMNFTCPGDVDPEKLIEAIDDFGVNNLFGSPALLNRVGRWGAPRGVKLTSLKRVISAGAPVSAEVLERFTQMLSPGVEIVTPYGATESLPVCSIGSIEILRETRALTDEGKGVCVGRPVGDIRVNIIRITDEPIASWSDDLKVPAGHIGEIVVAGPVVTATYYNRPESTTGAKIHDPPDGFFHRMGDLGYFDESGRLWFCGRKSHRVRAATGDLFTIPCEGIFNRHPHVFRTALVGISSGGTVRPALCVELEGDSPAVDRERVREELLELGKAYEHTREIKDILFHPGFPVDIRHNAKIGRERLAVWARKKLS